MWYGTTYVLRLKIKAHMIQIKEKKPICLCLKMINVFRFKTKRTWASSKTNVRQRGWNTFENKPGNKNTKWTERKLSRWKQTRQQKHKVNRTKASQVKTNQATRTSSEQNESFPGENKPGNKNIKWTKRKLPGESLEPVAAARTGGSRVLVSGSLRLTHAWDLISQSPWDPWAQPTGLKRGGHDKGWE